jgi:NADPH-dependent 2,4-dienoyl-CoA reductase/sulfur reductase-like enzyme
MEAAGKEESRCSTRTGARMREMSDPSARVLVVGAGPTGLLLAAELERPRFRAC